MGLGVAKFHTDDCQAYFSDVKPAVSTSLLVAAVAIGVLVFWALVIAAIRQWME